MSRDQGLTELGLYESIRNAVVTSGKNEAVRLRSSTTTTIGAHLLLSADRLATKEASVQAVQGLFRSVKISEGDVNLAGRILFDMDAGHSSVLGLTLVFDVFCKFFVPVRFGFSV